MTLRSLARAVPCASLALAACSGGGGGSNPSTPRPMSSPSPVPTVSPSPSPAGSATPTPTPTPTPTAQPQVVYLNFAFAKTTSSYGTLAFYAMSAAAQSAQPITVVAGSKLVFSNTDTSPHTASGLGSGGFPSSFTNANGPTAEGSTVDGSAWSSGALSPGATSAVFTVGAPGTYYFGCYYHYSLNMQDVIVSTAS